MPAAEGRLARLAKGPGAIGSRGITSGMLSLAATGLTLLTTILLTRSMDQAEFGIFAFVIALVSLLAVPSLLGFDRLIVREVAAYRARSAWSLIRGLGWRSNQIVALLSVGFVVLLGGAGWVIGGGLGQPAVLALWIGLLALPLTTLGRVRQAMLSGLHHVIAGQLPETAVRPGLLLLLVAIAAGMGMTFDAPRALAFSVIATATAFLVGVALLRRSAPREVTGAQPLYATRTWLASAVPLVFMSGASVVLTQTPLIVLGLVRPPEEAALYAVAARGAALIQLPLNALNAVIAPTLARQWATGEVAALQRLTTRAARAVLLAGLPVATAFIFVGERFLSVFGESYLGADLPLAILSLGQLFNVAMGSTGLLLVMAGKQQQAAVATAVTAAAQVALLGVLAPLAGAAGAACASATSLVLLNLLWGRSVVKELHVIPSVVGASVVRRGR